MFTLPELQIRLARNMRTTKPTAMASDESLAMLDAINSGLSKTYANLPPIYRRTKGSSVLRAPVSVSLTCTKYSTTISPAFSEDDRGKTLVIPEDQGDNEIVSTVQIANQYLGTTGTKESTVYSDCVWLDEGIVAVVSHPKIIVGSCKRALCRVDAEQFRLWGNGANKCVGAPTQYYVAPVGQSMNGSPMALMKVHPMPDQDYRIEFEMEVQPKRFSFTDLNNSVHIPIQEAYIESILVPFCEWELSSSRCYTGDRIGANDKKNEALAYCKKIATELLPTNNRVGTPIGF